MSNNLILHAGGFKATREEVDAVITPEPKGRWYPVAHNRLIDQTIGQLESFGLKVESQQHALAKDGARYFGVFNLIQEKIDNDFNLAIGLRNSHDKTIVAGLSLGTRVFVCDNLAFGGEVTIARKHTRYIDRDLPKLLANAVGKIVSRGKDMDDRVTAYKQTDLLNHQANNLLVHGLKSGVIGSTKVLDVLKEWEVPSHDAFAPRTAWSLFNAFTEVLKGYEPHTLVKRTQTLYGLFDQQCGVLAA